MRTRTRKILSLLLATAMVFTMNTSVFAAEITEDEAAIESVAVDEAEAAVEEAAEISTVSGARGWSYDVSSNKFGNTEDPNISGNILYIRANPITSLAGTTDSLQLTVSPCSPSCDQELSGFKVNPGKDENAGGSVQVTFVASNDDGFAYLHYTSGNKIVSVAEDAEEENTTEGWKENYYSKAGKETINKNFKAFAAAACGTGVESTTTSVDFKSGMASATFILPTSVVEEKNVSYGYDNRTFDIAGGSLFEFNKKAPYSGNLKNADLVKLLGISLSANNESYTVKKMKLKHKKSWGNKGRIYVQKITGGTKKYRNKLKKAINKEKIYVEIYPYNLNASDSKAKVKKIKKKSGNAKYVKIKLFKKNTTLKNGKSDKWGGTPSLTLSNNEVTISGSNLFTGIAKK